MAVGLPSDACVGLLRKRDEALCCGLDVRFWFQAMTFMLDRFPDPVADGRPITPRAFKCGFRSIHLRPGESFKKNLGHHPFVLMLQEVTVEYRDAANDRVREIHDEIE